MLRLSFAMALAVSALGCAPAGPSDEVVESFEVHGHPVGDDELAPLFETVDENMQPIDMADLIDGKPLVLTVGSAS